MPLSDEKRRIITNSRTKQISEVSLRLFDEKGYSNTTISDIAKEAGISKGLLYRYFSSKEDLLYSNLDGLQQCLDECASYESARDGIKEFGMRLLSYPYYHDYVPPIRIFFKAYSMNEIEIDPEQCAITENFGREYFGKLFKRGQDAGEFRSGDPYVFAEMYWSYLLNCLNQFSRSNKRGLKNPNIDKILEVFDK